MKKEKFIVCCALPYANGPFHVGHFAGCYIPGDVYARFRRMQGHDVHFICGSDEHGVAITLLALKEGKTPQEIVDHFHGLLKQDLIDARVSVDIFSRTTAPCHYNRSQDFFLRLYKKGLIEKKTENRLFCEQYDQFLPDRYVVGTCPRCGHPDARGDECEKCGSWYEPEELLNPVFQYDRTAKVTLKETSHWYIRLDLLEKDLEGWLHTKTSWRKNVMGYAMQPIKAELAPRSITRDLSWGIPVPLEDAKNKVLYVWFDAPIGYISASKDWAIKKGEPDAWKKYWEDKESKLVHFIGKDNVVFHTVVWPAVLIGDGRYSLPHLVAANEFLNLEGKKISTSRNYAVWAKEAIEAVGPDLLRYYLTRIAPESSDSDFSWSDFQSKVNTELADVIGNLFQRSLTFLNKYFEGTLTQNLSPDYYEPVVQEKITAVISSYITALEGGFSKIALEEILSFGRFLNVYLQERAPWTTRKTDLEKAHKELSIVVSSLSIIAVLITPICPGLGEIMWEQLGGVKEEVHKQMISLEFLLQARANTTIHGTPTPLVTKITDEFVEEQRSKLKIEQ